MLPFMDRMGIVFLLSLFLIWIFARIEGNKDHEKAITISFEMFKTSKAFVIGSIGVIAILILFYSLWW